MRATFALDSRKQGYIKLAELHWNRDLSDIGNLDHTSAKKQKPGLQFCKAQKRGNTAKTRVTVPQGTKTRQYGKNQGYSSARHKNEGVQ